MHRSSMLRSSAAAWPNDLIALILIQFGHIYSIFFFFFVNTDQVLHLYVSELESSD